MEKIRESVLRIDPTAFIALFSGSALIYLLQSILYIPSASTLHKYHLSSGQATALVLTIAVPYLAIWLLAVLGYRRLWLYTAAINNSNDGDGFAFITLGIFLLSAWLPFSTIIGNFTSHYYQLHPASTAAMVRWNNYLNIATLYPAFYCVYRGSTVLCSIVKTKAQRLPVFWMSLFIIFSAIYTYLTFHDQARATAVKQVQAATYYLSDWLIVTTVVIPYLLMWFLGFVAVYKIYQYRKYVKGILYKEALAKLATGVCWILVMVITLRLFQTLSVQLSNLNLGWILLIIYLLLILIGVGYLMIAQGSKRLQRLEEL